MWTLSPRKEHLNDSQTPKLPKLLLRSTLAHTPTVTPTLQECSRRNPFGNPSRNHGFSSVRSPQEESTVARLPKRQRFDDDVDDALRLVRSSDDAVQGTGLRIPFATSWPSHSAALNNYIETVARHECMKPRAEEPTLKLLASRLSDYLAPGGTKRFRPRLEWVSPIPLSRGKRPRTCRDGDASQPPAAMVVVPREIVRRQARDDHPSAPNNGLLPDNAFAEYLVAARADNEMGENEEEEVPLQTMESDLSSLNDIAISNTFGRDSDSALHMAIRENAVDAALELIHLGAPVNAENGKHVTPLILACQKGIIEVAKELLSRGANTLAATLTGSTSLLQACHFGHLEIVKLLLDCGAMMEMANHKNTTPLMRAAQEGHEQIVKLLLDKGAKVNRRNNEHMSALMLASQRGHAGIVKLLLEAKAEIDAMTAQRSTSLMLACKREHVNVVQVLVGFGCELFIRDSRGRTATDVATRENRKDLLRLLEPAKQIELMQRKSRVERNYIMASMWVLLQQDRASVCTANGNISLHDVSESYDAGSLKLAACEKTLVRTMTLPAPMVELIASFMPLPRLWDERLALITKRCRVDADAAVSCAMDLIDEVLEEGGFLDACRLVNITPPTHFKSWEAWRSWGFRHNHLDPTPSAGYRVNALTATLPGLPRVALDSLDTRPTLVPMNARDWRRGICYLQILAHRSSLLPKALTEPPFNIPPWLIDQLITVNDIQSLSRRLGNRGAHFEASVAIELVMLASSVVSWYGRERSVSGRRSHVSFM
ncbi:hypothetical protein MHU86_21909 [Fragilaria crotonensis]|nr:hypothetical protein MHU86_21909 [Fragilaria crotonensis]